LLRTNWLDFARNVTRLSISLQALFDSLSPYDDMIWVAQYSSFTTSLATKVALVQPKWGPTPFPAPSDDQGIINILSYITEFITQQVDRRDVAAVGGACTQLLDEVLVTDWSGSYSWGKGRGYGQWDANSWKHNFNTIYGYCARVAALPPSTEGTEPEPVPEPPVDDSNTSA
jgi:hypothetical protein